MAPIQQLIDDLKSADEARRSAAAETLEEVGPPPVELLPWLGERVGDDQLDTSYWAATLLGRAGAASAAYVEVLVSVATDPTHALAARERCVWALGEIGPAARDASDSLRKLSHDPPGPRLGRLADAALDSINA